MPAWPHGQAISATSASHGPEHWEAGLGVGAAHLLLVVNAITHDELADRLVELHLAESGMSVVHEDHAEMLPTVREHFGYADGLAQPAVAGINEQKARGGGTPEAHDQWRALALGEFILGYDDEASLPYPTQPPPSAPADPLGKHGTYMVWRKLKQDVAAFRSMVRDAADPAHGRSEAVVAAKIVGRWQSGAALVLSPDSPDGGRTPDGLPDNDFRYHDDPDGRRCPIGSHVRRSNPRDALGYEGTLTFRHRMIRRGMPYGPPLPAGVTDDDGQERGLIFVCFVASISRQFEGVQTQWMEDGNIFGLGHDKDFLQRGSGEGKGKMTVQGDPPYLIGPDSDFVTMRGGEYLFVPSITALGVLADGLVG